MFAMHITVMFIIGVIRGTYLALEHMRKDKPSGKGGQIVITASIQSLGIWPCWITYASTKWGVLAFCRSLAETIKYSGTGYKSRSIFKSTKIISVISSFGTMIAKLNNIRKHQFYAYCYS